MENTTLHHEWAAPMAADIAAARLSVFVTSLSLQPLRHASTGNLGLLWDALESAVRNGANVTFALAQTHPKQPATLHNTTSSARLAAVGIKPLFAPPANLLHAKTVCIDGQISWVGSGNWTAAAAGHNREMYLRCESRSITESLLSHWHSLDFRG